MCGQPRLNYVRVILHIQAEVRFTQCFSESRFMESLTVDQSRRRGLLLFDGRQDAECEIVSRVMTMATSCHPMRPPQSRGAGATRSLSSGNLKA